METVFSQWIEREDGTFESEADLIRGMQNANYFVLLIFVGLASVELSVSRVATRVLQHGHGVAEHKLRERFARTQKAVAAASKVANASLLTDNSRDQKQALIVCRVEIGGTETFDIRHGEGPAPPKVIMRLLDVVAVRP